MPKIITNENSLEFKVLPSEIQAIDDKYFSDFGHQIRYVLCIDFIKGLGNMDEINSPKLLDRIFYIELLNGSIKLLENQWLLIDKKYKVKVNDDKWNSGILSGRINDSEFYSINCRGNGKCILKTSVIGKFGIGHNAQIIDLRLHDDYVYKELSIKIKGVPTGNTLLKSLIDMLNFLTNSKCDKFTFHP